MAERYITADGVQYELTFEDCFEGDALDLTKWERCPEQCRQDIGGYWRDAMSEVKDGRLILWAKLDEAGHPISGGIRTRGLFEQAKGYFVCRMKMHRATGFWGAFWMMCGNVFEENGTAVTGVEIDIIESGERARGAVNHALHWDGYGAAHKSVVSVVPDESQYDGNWHTYALRWTDEAYIFYIDGKETWRTAEPGVCVEPGYMKLTTEFGTWAKPLVPEQLPDCVEVDWVRAYREVK